jgi:hypothetical protein
VVTVLSTVLIALAFNFDMSRYQLASLFGVISAIRFTAGLFNGLFFYSADHTEQACKLIP